MLLITSLKGKQLKVYAILLALITALLSYYMTLPTDEEIQKEMYPDIGKEIPLKLYLQKGTRFGFEDEPHMQ